MYCTLNTDREVTPIVVWFYINMLYFPYNAQDLAKVTYEDFSKPIFESLERVADILAEEENHQNAQIDEIQNEAEK